MKEFSKRKRLKKILYSKLSIVLLLLVLFFIARASFFLYLKQNESRANEVKAKAELAILQSRQEALASEIKRLGTKSGVEEEIRDKFKVAKADENMIVIVNNEKEVAAVPPVEVDFWKGIMMKVVTFFTGEK